MRSVLDDMLQGRTLVFGHRGAKAYAPMNTLPAFELAAQQGADGIELDVWLSKDGQVVVIHDRAVDETTDGSGLITDMTLAQIRELDAGNWFGESFRGTRIPTLDDVFEAVGQRLFINVEIKSESLRSLGLEQAVADRIARFGLKRRVLVSSFDPFALRRFRHTMPDVPIGFLYAEDVPRYLRLFMLGYPHEARHPHHTLINTHFMTWAREHHFRVNTWTVNDPARAVELRNLGVDILITDAPDIIREALHG